MRFASFILGGRPRCCFVDLDNIAPLPAELTSVAGYLALTARERQTLRAEKPIALAEVQLTAPVHPAKNVFCVGRNYLGHAEEIARARGVELKLPNVPTFFTKAPTTIVGAGATLHLSRSVSHEYDWEAELAVVIGARCRDVPLESALDVIFGYTALNDVTARDLQREHGQWFKGKSLDETCPIGPWIVTADEIPDPQALEIELRVN